MIKNKIKINFHTHTHTHTLIMESKAKPTRFVNLRLFLYGKILNDL